MGVAGGRRMAIKNIAKPMIPGSHGLTSLSGWMTSSAPVAASKRRNAIQVRLLCRRRNSLGTSSTRAKRMLVAKLRNLAVTLSAGGGTELVVAVASLLA